MVYDVYDIWETSNFEVESGWLPITHYVFLPGNLRLLGCKLQLLKARDFGKMCYTIAHDTNNCSRRVQDLWSEIGHATTKSHAFSYLMVSLSHLFTFRAMKNLSCFKRLFEI